MANLKISQLTNGNPALAGDIIPIDRAGANFSITAASIAALGGGLEENTPGHGGFWGISIEAPGSMLGVNAVGANNVLYVDEFTLPFQVTVSKLTIQVTGSAFDGHFSVGIYDQDGNLLIDSGQFDTHTPATLTQTLGSPVVLPAGIYYLAGISDNTNNTLVVFNGGPWVTGVGIWNANYARHASAANTWDGSFNLPVTLGALTPVGTGIYYPPCVFFEP